MRMKNYINIIFVLSIIFSNIYSFEIKRSIKELSNSSDIIITGSVSKIESVIEKKKNRDMIYTYVTINILSILKGDCENSTLLIKMEGGKTNNLVTLGENYISFKVNEEVILFLNLISKFENLWEINSISGKIEVLIENNRKFGNCAMLINENKKHNNSESLKSFDLLLEDIKNNIKQEGE